VQDAFARWSSPPRYELYDLETDPGEWTDLASNPAYAADKTRLIDALQQWQAATGDPFSVQEHVDAFVAEQLANRDLGYRKRPKFRWSYLETFAKWRAAKAATATPK
jgi:N-sulfoglucosamine sulfohydrolase